MACLTERNFCIKKPQTKLFQPLNRELTRSLAPTLALKTKKKKKKKEAKKRKEGRKKERKHKVRHSKDQGQETGRECRGKRIPYERGICKGQEELVFHDVTHSMSVSGKVLEKADMDFFHSNNVNYSYHASKRCFRSKKYCVQGMKEDNLDIYSLPTS